MAQKPTSEREVAARLLQALRKDDPLDHTQVQALLLALVEAELAGEDVDAMPEFEAVLAHLDHCEDCLSIYEGLASDVALLISDEQLPEAPPAPPLLAALIDREGVLLRVLGGLRRRLELSLNVPNLVPVSSGGPGAVTLFAEPVTAFAGSPTLRVVLDVQAQPPLLRVALVEGETARHWHILLLIENETYTAITDDRGVAELGGFTAAQLHAAGRLEVRVVEHTGDDD